MFAQEPADAVATQREKQIAYEGGVTYYKADGTEGSESDYAVKLTKTVKPTGTENRFTINLEVETRQNIEELQMAPDAAVVLVYDCSGSMGVYDTKAARDASARFLETYVEGAGDAQRKVALVQFGTTAQTILNWTEANAGETVSDAVVASLDNVENCFTYYACYEQGEHQCKNTLAYVSPLLLENLWTIEIVDGYTNYYICKECGHSTTDGTRLAHFHCTLCKDYFVNQNTDMADRAEFVIKHQHPDTYVGPHSPLYDGMGYLMEDGSGPDYLYNTGEPSTNLRGGLQLARNLLLAGQQQGGAIEGINNVYVILLSDGCPTVKNGEDLSDTQEISFLGRGSTGVDNYISDIPALAQDIQGTGEHPATTGAKFFTVGYSTGMSDYLVGDLGDLPQMTTEEWLKNYVKVDQYYAAKDSDELVLKFEGIAQLIKTMANAWIVTDPMPDGGYVTFATTGNEFDPQKFARWDEQNNQVVWDLKQMIPDDTTGSGENLTYTYNLSYDVILHPEEQNFVQEQAYPTNGQAKLSYLMLEEGKNLDDMTPEEITDLLQTVNFETPEVQGYLGQFNFMKYAAHQDAAGKDIPLSGATFKLSNDAATNLDAGAGKIERMATSKNGAANETSKGQVEFTSIPSGYTYTLSETDEFESDDKIYEPTDKEWSVIVSYGVPSGGPGAEGVRNTLKQEDLTLTLTKTWQAPDTTAITVEVYRKDAGAQDDGTMIATLTLNGNTCNSSDPDAVQVTCTTSDAKQWVYTLTVDRYNLTTGGEYTYTVKEQALSGYTTTYGEDTLSITNTATGKNSVYVEKKWLDIDGQPMTGMPAVEVTLIGNTATDPNKTLGTATLSEDSLFHTWTNVPVYDAYGNAYTYSVSEAQGDYRQVGAVTGTGRVNDPFVITNTVLEGTVDIPVTKTWKDGGAAARPAFITVELLRDNQSFSLTSGTTTTVELTSANEDPKDPNVWTYTFTGLPQYQFLDVNGDEVNDISQAASVRTYKYTVKELGADELEGYTSVQDGDRNIINTRTETVAITVEKVWDDGENSFTHGEVTIDLYRNGQKLESKETTGNVAVFENLARYDENGVEYSYTVVEPSVPANYTVSYDYGTGNDKVVFESGAGTATVTNTLNENDDTVSLTVNKVWQHPAGTTAPAVTFTVIQMDEDGAEVNPDFKSYTMEAGTTTYTFTDLPKYYYVDIPEVKNPETDDVISPASVEEREYQYSVVEGAVDGYNSSDPAVEGDTWTFTNTITGTVELSVEKVWVSTESSYPQATITLQRQANGGVWETVGTWATTDNASHDWGELDKYDANGQLYTYKVVEASVSGYSTAYAPANATYGEGTNKVTVTNTQSQDQTGSLVATKTWNDNGNAEGLRTDITLHLWQKYNGGNDADLGTVVISADGTNAGTGTYQGQVLVEKTTNDKWTITFSQLEKIANVEGQVYRYEYYVTEDTVLNYTTNISGGKDITNTLAQGTTQVQLTKTWIDPQGTNHPSVTFTLTAETTDGKPVNSVTNPSWTFPQTVTLGFADGNTKPQNQSGAELTADGSVWYYTWTDLPTHTDDQEQIVYKVSEGAVAGYTSVSGQGNTFTNTIEQEKLNFTGTKTWDMSELESDDYLKPDAQPVWIALYYVSADGKLGQMVDGSLTQVQPVDNGDGTITASFAFNDLPRYNLSSGAEYKYTVREVEETVGQDGQKGYSAIANGGTITFQIKDAGQTYDYNYTVKYEEQPTGDDNYTGSNTQVTNTYGDPQYYFYKILANYTTKFSDNGQTIYTATGVNVTPDNKGYIALTPEEFAALTGGTVTVDPDDYATRKVNDDNVTFDFVANGSNVSVTLDEVNHMYVITLNYERELHKLTVNYTFEGMQTPPSGFESVTTPTLGTPDGEGNYSDPGCYTSGQSYTVDPKTGSIPTGYELTKVIVNGEEKPVSFTGGSFGTGDGFEDITVQYVYTRIPGTHPDITDRITVNKYDDGEPQQLITSSSATFGLYSDENCENQVRSYATSGGKVTIEASASGLGAGTYYLKEINAPTGYTLSDQVWKLTVTVTPKEEWYNNTWVNYNVYDITATLAGAPVTSIDVTDKLLRDDYVVEYYFEQTPDGDDYVKGEDRDGKEYPDVPGKIGYFDTVKAEDHYLPDEDVPDGYHHGHDEPAFIEYDDENKTIKIYYDLDVPANTVEGDKIWHGEQTTAYVAVYQKLDGTLGAQPYQTPVKVGETSNHFSFSNLPQYVGGKAATYEVYEVISDGHSGWTKVESGSKIELNGKDYQVSYDGANVVNTELMDIPVTKTWIDGESADRPGSVTIALYQNDQKVGNEVNLTAAANWKYTFQDLPKYDEDGDLYTYKVYEMNGDQKVENNGTIGDYTVTYAGENQRNITNKLTDIDSGETSAKVTKTWIAPWVDLPESITFQLYKTTGTTLEAASAEFVQDVVLTKPATESLEWTATVSDLPTRNAQGYRYTYFFEEQAVSGFELTDTNPAKTQFTNRIQQVSDVKVSVEKLWDGAIANSIPDSLFVQLYRDGVSMGDTYNVELKPDADGKWIHTFENLDRYDLTTGKYYSYTVQEGYFTDNEGVKTWNPVAESETITFNKDTGDYTFKVSYNTTGYETNKVQATITNTYDSCKLYQYRVDRVYNYYSDGDLVPGASSMVTGDVIDGTKDQIITVTDEEANAFKKTDGKEEFTYVTGDPAVDDGTGKLVPTVTLTKVGELCVITLLYEFRYNTPSPDYHKVTVNYYDQDGNKIAESFVSDRIREGRSWDFSDKVRDTITVDGVTYVLDHADGDPITGTNIRRDQVVDLHYVVQEPDVDIPDEDTPQGGEPDDPGDPGEPDEPDEPDGPDVEIPDPEVPEGDLPQTGTTADQMSVSAGGLLGVSAILAATGLVVVEFSRRKEQEDN